MAWNFATQPVPGLGCLQPAILVTATLANCDIWNLKSLKVNSKNKTILLQRNYSIFLQQSLADRNHVKLLENTEFKRLFLYVK